MTLLVVSQGQPSVMVRVSDCARDESAIPKRCVHKLIYLSSSVNLGAKSGGGRGRAEEGGRSEDFGCGGGVWDSRDNSGVGATAVGDGGGLESGESVGLGGTGDGGTGGTASDGGSVNYGGRCVRGTGRRSHSDGVVSGPGIGNTGGGGENKECRLHCDFGFWMIFVCKKGRLRDGGIKKDIMSG